MVTIRRESPGDADAIHLINEKAFGQPQEADIVAKLRNNCCGILSLVALQKGRMVGHILFSPAAIEGKQGVIQGMGLALMAVMPEVQRQGIGGALVREGIQILKEAKCPLIIVLGHPEYYPRFGFAPASRYGLRSQWEDVPGRVFMILWFDGSMARVVSGVAKFRAEFNEAV